MLLRIGGRPLYGLAFHHFVGRRHSFGKRFYLDNSKSDSVLYFRGGVDVRMSNTLTDRKKKAKGPIKNSSSSTESKESTQGKHTSKGQNSTQAKVKSTFPESAPRMAVTKQTRKKRPPATLPAAATPAAPSASSSILVTHSNIAKSPSADEPLKSFFTSFIGFEYKSKEPAATQMVRLRKFLENAYNKKDKTIREEVFEDAKQRYNTAHVRQFHRSYGRDEDDLVAWHKLLRRCGITPLPGTPKECKKVSIKRRGFLVH